MASATSARPHRDIKGWILSLLDVRHAARWDALASDACSAARASGGAADDIARTLARAVMESVIVRQGGESKRIATSNARRQGAREVGRLTLVRLVDVALAVREIRDGEGGGVGRYAAAFRGLCVAVRALRAVDEMDEAGAAVERFVNDPVWWEAYGGRAMREAVLRTSGGGGGGFLVVRGEDPILGAAALADGDKKRAVLLADRRVGIDGDVAEMLRRGEGPLPLKQMRLVLYCDAAMIAGAGGGKVMEKLHTLFVPRDWHRNTGECRQSGGQMVHFLRSMYPANLAARSICGDWLVKEGEEGEAKRTLEDAAAAGDVMAPITLANIADAVERKNELLWMAVERGSSLAALTLGRMYEDAHSTEHADQCYQLSVSRGSSIAALKLAKMYHYGFGGAKRDAALATRFYTIAKERGEEEHQDVHALAVVGMARLKFRTGHSGGEDGASGGESTECVQTFVCDTFGVYDDESHEQSVPLRGMVGSGIFGAKLESHEKSGDERPSVSDALRAIEVAMRKLEDTEREALSESFGSAVILLAEARGESDHQSTAESWESLFSLVAVSKFTNILDKRQALFYLGCLKRSQDDDATACAYFLRSADAGHAKAPNNAGIFLCNCGRYEEALKYFALGAERSDASSASNAAFVCLKNLDRFHSGLDWYERAITLGSASAPVNLAKVLIEEGELTGEAPKRERLQHLLTSSLALGFSGGEIVAYVQTAINK